MSVVVIDAEELATLIESAVRRGIAAIKPSSDQSLEWLDTAGAAAILNVHPRTAAKLAKSGDLPASRIGKLWRFRRADVFAYLEHQRVGG